MRGGLVSAGAARVEIDVFEVRGQLVDGVLRQVRGAGRPRVLEDARLPVVAGTSCGVS